MKTSIYLVTVGDEEGSFDLVVRHARGDHEGVARLVAESLLADDNFATPGDQRRIDVFEHGPGSGVLSQVAESSWVADISQGVKGDWALPKWLRVRQA